MRPLHRKLFRDLWRLKWQVSAIAMLIACGVSVAVMAFSTQKTLVLAQRAYYAQTRFGDLFADATRAPLSLVDDLRAIEGVTAVDPRAMKSGLMVVPGLLRPATVRLISLPDDDRRALNRVVIVSGRLPSTDRMDEAVALATFLDAAHVSLGERLSMTIEGRELTFTIVGAALSPEYVYVPSNGPMPDDAHEAVLWAPRNAVERPVGLGGAFSTVSLALAPGASEGAALAAVDRVLARYGGRPAYGRADQISHKFQEDRIDRLGVMATVIPPIFLIVAAALVNLVLGRLVEGEREQIGLLKAFGYGDVAAAMPYLELAALIGACGVAAGGLCGAWVSGPIVDELGKYMRFPHLLQQFSWSAYVTAGAVSMVAALAGSSAAVWRAVRLSPAVAMQPPAPATFHRGMIERSALWAALDQPTRIIVRNIERFPLRAVLTTAGLSLSVSLLVGSQFLFGSIDLVVNREYYQARRWTDQVAFAEPRDIRAVAEVAHLPAVIRAEPVRTTSGWMRAHGAEERIEIVGLDAGATLTRVLDVAQREAPLVSSGVFVSQALAARLSLQRGDLVQVEPTEGLRPRALLRVSGISGDYGGLLAYIDRAALNRVLAEGDVASGVGLIVDPDNRGHFYRAVARLPRIVSANSRDDTVASFRSAVSAALTVEMSFFLGFAGAIAFGVAFNISRIALANRARDLATLRVLGFRPGECAYTLVGELALLALPALPIGVVGGIAQAHALAAAFARQDFYVPVIVTARGLAISFATYAVAVAVAAALVAQRVWTFDLVEVLKTRD